MLLKRWACEMCRLSQTLFEGHTGLNNFDLEWWGLTNFSKKTETKKIILRKIF
jgi:hypothetical protein